MEKLSFKQYMESKIALKEAIEQTPVQSSSYSIKRYGKLPVGESKKSKEYINVKPKQQVIVEWKYNDVDQTPEPLNIRFIGVANLNESIEHNILWSGEKLQKWLESNAFEINTL